METFSELYYKKPYIKEFDAVVISCEPGDGVWLTELSETAFYPEGGGQLPDKGVLVVSGVEMPGGAAQTDAEMPEAAEGAAQVSVLNTQKKNGRILHYTDREIPAGTKVHGILDWQRRFDHMQGHSGEHVVSGIIHKWFGYDNIGFHMDEDRITIDFDGQMTKEQVEKVELEANRMVWENLAFQEMYPTEEEREQMDYRSKIPLSGIVRIVNIPGVDMCACCGTHVCFTGEIGLIKFLSFTNRKKGVRIEMVCGRRALEAYRAEMRQTMDISHLISAKPTELTAAVAKIANDLAAAKAKIKEMNFHAMDEKIAKMTEKQDIIISFTDEMGIDELRYFCNQVMDKQLAGSCAALSLIPSETEHRYNYVIASSTVDLKKITKEMNRRLNGRGGGSSIMIQGSFLSEEDEIRAQLAEILK